MNDIIFPTFFKISNSYTAAYSESKCITASRSFDSKLVSITMLELNSLNLEIYSSLIVPISEAEFLAAYRKVQVLITAALFANHSTDKLS